MTVFRGVGRGEVGSKEVWELQTKILEIYHPVIYAELVLVCFNKTGISS
ncbi:MAG: hypothetical protein ACPGTO_10585 [Polaribacter sp.]